jgi:hypothetical protein
MSIRERCCQIFAFFQRAPQGTVREAADAVGISKSGAHRHKQAIARRNQYPESWLWETDVGYRWLIRFVCATIYMFGIRGGMGVRALSEFFHLVRVDTHLGVSPSSLCRLVARIEDVMLAYKERHEQPRKGLAQVIAGADETFFDQIILVVVELSSGYILLEESAEDRTFPTWNERAVHALQRLGLQVRYMVSDKAKALTKLALDGLSCPHIPDLFHACHELVQCLGGRFATSIARVQRKLSTASEALDRLHAQVACPEKIRLQAQQVEALTREQQRLKQGQQRYLDALHDFSKAVHPFSLTDVTCQTSSSVRETLQGVLKTLRSLTRDYAITDSTHRLDKVERQIPEIAAVIDVWWTWADETIRAATLPQELATWLRECMLPAIYWDIQTHRASSAPLLHAYRTAHQQAQDRLRAHPLTTALHPQELSKWQRWAHWMVMKFQRTSSAVEGRNGVLSRMNHAQRAIPMRRLKVLTIVHNSGLRREDGTTAAERLFGEPFPDLFEWIVEHINDVPVPREHLASAS